MFMYDANGVEIKTTRGAVLRGWYVSTYQRKDSVDIYPLVKGANQSSNQNIDTAAISKAPQQILQPMPPPTRDALTALSLRSYIYGRFTSCDWYSGHAHAARPQGRTFKPRRVRYIVFALLLSRSVCAQM